MAGHINEQQRAHADLGRLIDEHGMRPWVAEWLDSKSYVRPLAKGRLSQLRKAIDREISEKSGAGSNPPVSGDGALGSPAPGDQSGTGERAASYYMVPPDYRASDPQSDPPPVPWRRVGPRIRGGGETGAFLPRPAGRVRCLHLRTPRPGRASAKPYPGGAGGRSHPHGFCR